jgi:two-component system alkaline phosphatase synthesis response regulator PhoP
MATESQMSRVLVVEDEETLLFTLAHNLRREGYDVITAQRGDDGLRLAREKRPDLILLDLMLPGMDGIQVCRLLRRDMSVPIIMLTALGGESDRVVGLDTGADDYLTKPFGMRELMARIRAHLRRAHLGIVFFILHSVLRYPRLPSTPARRNPSARPFNKWCNR